LDYYLAFLPILYSCAQIVDTAAATKIAPKCGQFFFLLQNGNFLQYFYSVCKGK